MYTEFWWGYLLRNAHLEDQEWYRSLAVKQS